MDRNAPDEEDEPSAGTGDWTSASEEEIAASKRLDRQTELAIRLKAGRKSDGRRPLAKIAAAEAELKASSLARRDLRELDKRVPHPTLLAHQLSRTVDAHSASGHLASELRADARRLFASLDSTDSIDAILNEVLVAATNATMGSFARAADSHKSEVRQMELRSALKGTEAIIKLVKERDARNGSGPQRVVVENVNVESGGQAIVGNVTTETEGKE